MLARGSLSWSYGAPLQVSDRDWVAIADPFRDWNPVPDTPIFVAIAPKPVGFVQKPLELMCPMLGDNVVIADAQVAEVYSQCLQRVQIETKKSYRGSAEFAKRFRIHGLETDLSPVYIRCLMNEHLSSIWPCCFTAHVPCEEVLHSLQSGWCGIQSAYTLRSPPK